MTKERMAMNQCDIRGMAREARAASPELARASGGTKNAALHAMAAGLLSQGERILAANAEDVAGARAAAQPAAFVDRLTLTRARLEGMARGLRQVADLPDPVGEITGMWRRPNGLLVGRMRIPLGVIGIIYESRPNVTADAGALCLKSGNAVILRGGSEAIKSNLAIVSIFKEVLAEHGVNGDVINLLPTTDREAILHMLQLEELIDLIIPRGGEELIRFVASNSRVPVIKHYKGVCHLFVDKAADIEMAVK